jgi:hypothetical protein
MLLIPNRPIGNKFLAILVVAMKNIVLSKKIPKARGNVIACRSL